MSLDTYYELLTDGTDYQKKYLSLIQEARSSISIHTYIFKIDNFGRDVIDNLILKSKEGVIIDILIDYFGSLDFRSDVIHELLNNKIQFKFFNPIKFYKTLQLGRRLHHKLLVVDESKLIIGGINLIHGYDHNFPKHPRLDFAMLVHGSCVSDVRDYCHEITQNLNTNKFLDKKILKYEEKDKVKFIVNDWFNERKQITARYYELIKRAESEILLIHGYFFPSARVLRLLRKKSKLGVKVKLLLPEYSDWKTWVWATSYLYKDLIENNIEVLKWPHSNLHGKLAIFDNKIITLGSHNLNYTSSYGNLEMNVEISDHNFVSRVSDNIEKDIIKNSSVITVDNFYKRFSPVQRIRNMFFYLCLSLISRISVNWIKFGRGLLSMPTFWMLVILTMMFVGILGILLPIIPGIPFLVFALLIYSAKKTTS